MSIRELTDAECRRVAFGNEEVIEEIVVVGRRPDRPSISSDFGLQAMQEQIQQQQMMDMLASMQESTAQLPPHLDEEERRQEDSQEQERQSQEERIQQKLDELGIEVNDDVDVSQLSDEILNVLENVLEAYSTFAPGFEIVITSTYEDATRQGRQSGSLHYENQAVDFRTRGLDDQQVANIVHTLHTELHSSGYDVVNKHNADGGPHIHLEYDPDD